MEGQIHLICNAHLDPVWLWQWSEGAAETLSTFRVAADFCEDYDGFVFNHNEALLYRWVEEYDPGLFARIQSLVRQGKWHIMGGWFLQPDCNMPSGESFVRHILVGRRYFSEKFSVAPTTAVNFDSFGHTRGLVQILHRSGYDSYLICRPSQVDCPTEDEITWVGFDGSHVKVHRSHENYNSIYGRVGEKLDEWLEHKYQGGTGCFLWGVGDHGGGPSRADMEAISRKARQADRFSLLHSTPERFFNGLCAEGCETRCFEASLQPCAHGCYTSQIRVKKAHRMLENEFYLTEKMSASAALNGLMPYPKRELDDALYDLLFSEFHDALPGSAIRSVEKDTLRLLDHGLETLSRLKTREFFALTTGQKKAVDGEIPILIYNPHPFPVEGIFECELVLPQQNWKNEFTLPVVYRDGEKIPSQAEKEESNFNMDWRRRTVFCAKLLPSQMNRFDCKFEVLPKKPLPQLREKTGIISFSNSRIQVTTNCKTGLIDRYAVDGVDYLKPSAFEPVIVETGYNPWGFDVEKARVPTDAFRLMLPEEGSEFSGVSDTIQSVRIIEDGPVRSVVEAVFRCRHSFICQKYKLPKLGTEIEIETTVFWNEKDLMLKLSVPTLLSNTEYRGQTAFGADCLKNDGSEVVSQKWLGLFEPGGGALTVVNNGIYGSDCRDGVLRLSLLRSPAYAASDFVCGKAIPPDRFTPRMDQGEFTFSLWVNAGACGERLRLVEREALIHNETIYSMPFCPSGCGIKPEALIEIDNDTVELEAFKRAENSDDFIIRLFESSGRATQAVIRLPVLNISFSLNFGGFEVKTIQLNAKNRTFSERDLTEGLVLPKNQIRTDPHK